MLIKFQKFNFVKDGKKGGQLTLGGKISPECFGGVDLSRGHHRYHSKVHPGRQATTSGIKLI
jgi:hypothetical protein